MASYNKLILMGNLTRDPEIKYTPSQTAVCEIGLAVNHKYKDSGGQMVEKCCFIDGVIFGKQAETFAQYMSKGKSVLIEGRLDLDQWEDKQTGAKRSKHKIFVERFTFTGDGEKREATPGSYEARTPAHQAPPADDGVPF